MKKDQILRAARKKAGMPQANKTDVACYVCNQLGVPLPTTWERRYKLMQSWAGPFPDKQHVSLPKPRVPAPPPPPKGESRRKRKQAERAQRDEFLFTYEWRRLRMTVLTKRGARCECCGATPKDGVRMNVDHIKPRLKYPELALEESNLQVLCEVCNHGKGNWDQTDWRGPLASERVQ